MRPVNLNATETRFLADSGAAAKAFNDLQNFSRCGFTRCIEKCSHVLPKWHSRRREIGQVQALG